MKKEKWETREDVALDILGNDYYDYFGLYDSMKKLLSAVILSDEEGQLIANTLAEKDKEQLVAAAKLFRQYGNPEKYCEIMEKFAGRDTALYLELI